MYPTVSRLYLRCLFIMPMSSTLSSIIQQLLLVFQFLFVCISVFIFLYVGFGVEQLRDGSLDTYWQSDGPQPHLVNIQFHRKMTIQDICIYADYKADESYTPSRYMYQSIKAAHYACNFQKASIHQ